MSIFSERLLFYRRQANLTQKQLSEKSGLEIINISQYERGIYIPKFETGKKLANALGISITDLYGVSDNKPVKPIVNKNVSKIMGCLYYDCGKCGNQLRSSAKFCDQCGKPVDLEVIKELEKGSENIE